MYQSAKNYEDCITLDEIDHHLKYLYNIREKSLDKIIRSVKKSIFSFELINGNFLEKQIVRSHVLT